jgi:hypothetical protein
MNATTWWLAPLAVEAGSEETWLPVIDSRRESLVFSGKLMLDDRLGGRAVLVRRVRGESAGVVGDNGGVVETFEALTTLDGLVGLLGRLDHEVAFLLLGRERTERRLARIARRGPV